MPSSKISAIDLVNELGKLDRQRIYKYVSGRSRLQVLDIEFPEGPVYFRNVKTDGSSGRTGTISKKQLATMALACSGKPNYPMHIDRLFSAGGNTRSAFETLLANTPHFFTCHPKRIDPYTGEVLRNLKHIMWCPDDMHDWYKITSKETDEVITDIELGFSFGDIGITAPRPEEGLDSIEAVRIHTQMQVALVEIGNALRFRTWIAKNDRSIPIGNEKLGELKGVIQTLEDMPIFYKPQIRDTAALIDCIWFTDDGDRVPAVIEIEHSTGVTSGLSRMQEFRRNFPAFDTTFVIIAPDELRNKVVTKANKKIFAELKAQFMPYSTVRELYGLIQRYSLAGYVDYKFIYPFMEQVVLS
jgi:hypothetical protein